MWVFSSSMAFRVVIVWITVVALTVAVWREIRPPHPPIELPPFREEVYLDVEAEWAEDGCIDVTTTTNLPQGTTFSILSLRHAHGKGGALRNDYTYVHKKLDVVSRTPRMKHEGVFCGIRDSYDGEIHTPSLLLRVTAPPTFGATSEPGRLGQAMRVGKNGSLLKGPRTAKSPPQPEIITVATSEIYVLELPGTGD